MKKKFKIASIILGITVLCAAGYILYIMKFKEYDVADESVDEIIGETFEIELPDGSKITLNEDGEVLEDASTVTDSTSEDNETTSSTDSTISTTKNDGNVVTSTQPAGTTTKPTPKPTQPSTPGNEEAKPTVSSIKEKYTPAFHALEGQADTKLNALVGRAKNEYLSKKDNGEKIDYGYFYNKYTSAAAELEGRTDTVFTGVLKAVEKDLEKNGYDKSDANSFVEQYNAHKKSRKDSLMKKVTGL
ncbi:hypothetical protein [Sporosarcina sp. OR05]|uniref:hypothetical protein n=1 Tax=Sporosarcina sp. OR05 TaxID=2969819 RepID=UPI00352A91B5